jgi:hypothetical protein
LNEICLCVDVVLQNLPAAARLLINEYFFIEVSFPEDGPLIEYPVRELRVSLFSDCILFSKPLVNHHRSESGSRRRETTFLNQNFSPLVPLQVTIFSLLI